MGVDRIDRETGGGSTNTCGCHRKWLVPKKISYPLVETNVTMENHHCFMGISTNYFDHHVQ